MSAKVLSSTVLGIEALPITVETEIIVGLKRFSIIGLPDGIVKEAKDRVRCAIENSGFEFPNGEVIVNLAPASIPKIGSGFDLAMAVGILSSNGAIHPGLIENYIFVGELALDGTINPVGFEISTAVMIRKEENKILVLSKGAEKWLTNVEDVKIVLISSLVELISFLRNPEAVEYYNNKNIVKDHERKEKQNLSDPFEEVIGQLAAKRALLIAASGGHNILMIGPPGSGKTMLASKLPKIMPPLESEECLEVNQIYGAVRGYGLLNKDENYEIQKRPFRSPHHTTSVAGLIGGGPMATPGEVTLAHRGVLFLDEFPEIRRDALECLREPLENGKISVSRAKFRLTYPSNFILVAAMNPCPCGKKGIINENKEKRKLSSKCECSEARIKKYVSKISGPILDRIDIQLWIPLIPASEIHNHDTSNIENKNSSNTKNSFNIVKKVREIQKERFKTTIKLNSNMTSAELKKFCKLTKESKSLLEMAADKYSFSTRAYTRIVKLARTISDMEESLEIKPEHIGEAISYRVQV